MEKGNSTSWTEFILVGFLNQMKTSTVIVTLFFFLFLMGLLENTLLLYLIQVDSGLRSPMYFFLWHLSLVDMFQILAVGPKMTVDFMRKKNIISLTGCSAQIFFTLTMGMAECLVLTVMSYDRYAAICNIRSS